MSPHRPMNGPPRVLSSQMLSCTGGSNCRGGWGRRLWSSSQWWGCTCNCKEILVAQKIAGKFFDDIEFLEAWCRSFVNYGIVEFVGIQSFGWSTSAIIKIFSSPNVLNSWINQQGRPVRNISWETRMLVVKVPMVSATPLPGGVWPCMQSWEFSFDKSTQQVTCENLHLMASIASCRQPLLASHHFLPPSSSSSYHLSPLLRLPTGLTWCLLQHWTLVFNISFTDFGVSNNSPLTMIICAQPVTLKLELKTIPFGYLHSADWAQSYSMSLDPLASLKYWSCHPLGEYFLFFSSPG